MNVESEVPLSLQEIRGNVRNNDDKRSGQVMAMYINLAEVENIDSNSDASETADISTIREFENLI